LVAEVVDRAEADPVADFVVGAADVGRIRSGAWRRV